MLPLSAAVLPMAEVGVAERIPEERNNTLLGEDFPLTDGASWLRTLRLHGRRQAPRLNPLVLPRSRLMSATTSCVEMFALTEGTSRGEVGVRSGTSA